MPKQKFTMEDFEQGLKLLGITQDFGGHYDEIVILMAINRRKLNLKDNRDNLRKYPRWRNSIHVYINWAKEESYCAHLNK